MKRIFTGSISALWMLSVSGTSLPASHVRTPGAGTIVRTLSVSPWNGANQPYVVDERTGRFILVIIHPIGTLTVLELDTRTGAPVLQIPLLARVSPQVWGVDEGAHRIIIGGIGVVSGPLGLRRQVVALLIDEKSGRTVRTIQLTRGPHSAGAVIPEALAVDSRLGRAYMVSAAGGIQTLSTRTGRILASVPVQTSGGASMAEDPRLGRVFVTAISGVVVIRAGNGHVVQRLPRLSFAASLAADSARHVLFVTRFGRHLVYAVDARSGQVLSTARIRGIPDLRSLGVDARTGSVVVAYTSPNILVRLDWHSNVLVAGGVLLHRLVGPFAIDRKNGDLVAVRYLGGTTWVINLGASTMFRSLTLGMRRTYGFFQSVTIDERAGTALVVGERRAWVVTLP